jgi:hypothetical protein
MNFAFTDAASSILTISCRPTGWHGESGAAAVGGHIVIDFYRWNGIFVTTQHIYQSDDAYGYRVVCFSPIFYAAPPTDK